MNKNEHYISVMLVPEDGTSVKKYRLSTKVFKLIRIGAVVLSIVFVIGIAAIIKLVQVTIKYRYLQERNTRLKNEAMMIKKLTGELDDMRDLEKRLKTLLGSKIPLPGESEIINITTKEILNKTPVEISRRFKQFPEFEKALLTESERLKFIPNEWPVREIFISEEFKKNHEPHLAKHYGIDIVAPAFANVKATASGKIIFANYDTEIGNLIIIDHLNGYVTHYGHNARIFVRENEIVEKGQTIALLGGTGSLSTAPHLHYAIYFKDEPKNPQLFLKPDHIQKRL